jgi:hypothetical protein
VGKTTAAIIVVRFVDDAGSASVGVRQRDYANAFQITSGEIRMQDRRQLVLQPGVVDQQRLFETDSKVAALSRRK